MVQWNLVAYYQWRIGRLVSCMNHWLGTLSRTISVKQKCFQKWIAWQFHFALGSAYFYDLRCWGNDCGDRARMCFLFLVRSLVWSHYFISWRFSLLSTLYFVFSEYIYHFGWSSAHTSDDIPYTVRVLLSGIGTRRWRSSTVREWSIEIEAFFSDHSSRRQVCRLLYTYLVQQSKPLQCAVGFMITDEQWWLSLLLFGRLRNKESSLNCWLWSWYPIMFPLQTKLDLVVLCSPIDWCSGEFAKDKCEAEAGSKTWSSMLGACKMVQVFSFAVS
jgi:hypothetical protein